MIDETTQEGLAVVVGAGTMGAGIAASLANAGWTVHLLDLEDAGSPDRNRRSSAGLARIRNSRPPLLFVPHLSSRIMPGNTADDLDALSRADWIVEAVAEQLPIKTVVMQNIARYARPDALISTNTSGLSIRAISEALPPERRSRFLGSHFFNPPRYLKLVELICTPQSDPAVVEGFRGFVEQRLGNTVVLANDTPGFISNRLGMWHLFDTIHLALEFGLTVEQVDVLTGLLIGRPRSGTFRLADLIGLDICADIAANQYQLLPDDPYRDRLRIPDPMAKLLESGRTGDKAGAGFYRKVGREILALDLTTGEYRERMPVASEGIAEFEALPLEERCRRISEPGDTDWERFLSAVVGRICEYSRYCGPEIAADALAVDEVMKFGFNWALGPLEISDLMDEPDVPDFYHGEGRNRLQRVFGPNTLQRITQDEAHIDLAELRMSATVLDSPEASLIDLGDGVACLEFHRKMNTLDPELVNFMRLALDRAEGDFAGLVVANQGPHFSAGYDLSQLMGWVEVGEWQQIDDRMREVQEACMALKLARIPVVAAPFGFTLGGGAEVAMHCAAAQAHVELKMGLPEFKVGLIPTGGGVKELMVRALSDGGDSFAALESVFDRVVGAAQSSSAHEAMSMGLLRPTDGLTPSLRRLIFEAKQRVLSGTTIVQEAQVVVPGRSLYGKLLMTIHNRGASGHDRFKMEQIAWLVSGGEMLSPALVSESYLMRLEREVFQRLVQTAETRDEMRRFLGR